MRKWNVIHRSLNEGLFKRKQSQCSVRALNLLFQKVGGNPSTQKFFLSNGDLNPLTQLAIYFEFTATLAWVLYIVARDIRDAEQQSDFEKLFQSIYGAWGSWWQQKVHDPDVFWQLKTNRAQHQMLPPGIHLYPPPAWYTKETMKEKKITRGRTCGGSSLNEVDRS